MRNSMRLCCASVICIAAASAWAEEEAVSSGLPEPLRLSMQPEPESVYAPPAPARPDEGTNLGAVHFDLAVGYFTDYLYRGIEVFEPPGAEDRTSLQVDAKLTFDLDKLPHPFIGVFVNYSDSDPESSFQEIRPRVGVDWTIRPLVLSAGQISYLYPERSESETAEVFGRVMIDNSYFLRTDRPLLSPYIYGAYDYDLYNGWYFEAGVSHDFPVEDTGLTLTLEGHVAYVRGMALFARDGDDDDDQGFQHYQVGLIASYSLNHLFNMSRRYGQWSFEGFVYYTDGIDDKLLADTQLWGGAGIRFSY